MKTPITSNAVTKHIKTSVFLRVRIDAEPNRVLHTSPATFAEDENTLSRRYPVAREQTDIIATAASPFIFVFCPVLRRSTAHITTSGWKDFKNIVEFDPTGVEDVADDAPAIEITSGGIQLTAAAEGKAIAIYTANGALVEKIDSYAGEEITLEKGVYIVRVGNKTMKVKL